MKLNQFKIIKKKKNDVNNWVKKVENSFHCKCWICSKCSRCLSSPHCISNSANSRFYIIAL